MDYLSVNRALDTRSLALKMASNLGNDVPPPSYEELLRQVTQEKAKNEALTIAVRHYRKKGRKMNTSQSRSRTSGTTQDFSDHSTLSKSENTASISTAHSQSQPSQSTSTCDGADGTDHGTDKSQNSTDANTVSSKATQNKHKHEHKAQPAKSL